MSTVNASTLVGQLLLVKQYNASLYKNISTAINAFSRSIGRELASYAEIDASISGLLHGFYYLAMRGNAASEEDQRRMAVQAITYPIDFAPMQKGTQVNAGAETIRLLEDLAFVETECAVTFNAAAEEPAGDDVSSILDLKTIARVSDTRSRTLKALAASIHEGNFWTRPGGGHWSCLQCGSLSKNPVAFEKCPCCKAVRAYAAPA